MSAQVASSIDDLAAQAWDGLAGTAQPFLRHRFLSLLESTGCASPATGWTPHHLAAWDGDELVGAVPLYLKTHSAGEFIFDWAWADVYQRAGRSWYPKLLAAVPFSPIRGRRLLGPEDGFPRLTDALLDQAREQDVASLQVLFPTEPEMESLTAAGFLARNDCRFLWRDRGYRDFGDFLDALASRKRKNIKRERRLVREAGIEHEVIGGDRLDPAEFEHLYRCYLDPYLRRGMQPYLSRDFFQALLERMGRSIVLILARRAGSLIAMALCLRDEDTLYGRHWGALEDVDSLHFETCYYQGIEYCIREGLSMFDPGTQGEHKLVRGFEPHEYHAAYWVRDADLRRVLDAYLEREREAIRRYIHEARHALPFRD